MNWEHLRAFLWLRSRLLLNQLRRGGVVNVVLIGLVVAVGGIVGVTASAGLFATGYFLLAEVAPTTLLYVWDGLVVAFLFAWALGLLSDLQRSEVLSLDKFLHLPVSLTGAFLINYLSSLLSVTLLLVAPALAALTLGLVLSRGPTMLLLFPLLAAFLLALTALTYQFQGWLASLMANPRRRRTVIVFVTLGFILICQVPNLVNLTVQPWRNRGGDEREARHRQERDDLQKQLADGKINFQEHNKRSQELARRQGEEAREARQLLGDKVGEIFWFANAAVPPGWLPLGARGLADGDVVTALLGTAGLTLIGGLSLWRSYKTTLKLYTGQFGGTKASAKPAAPKAVGPSTPATLLEKQLPGLSEQAAAIALSGLQGLLRAPEAKMLLLGPVIMVVVLTGFFLSGTLNVPPPLRPLLPFAGMSMVLLTTLGLSGNMFGFDRAGFRVFILCPASRRDILIGKNLAMAPFALGLGLVILLVLQLMAPLRVDHFLAAPFQFVSMYLIYALGANLLSILAPMPINPGTLKPANPKMLPILLQLVFVLFFPLLLGPTLVPLGLEAALQHFEVVDQIPVALPLTALVTTAVAVLYGVLVTAEGKLLHMRELAILETVASKAE